MANKKVLVLNGPNLNMLSIREPGIYGNQTLSEINSNIETYAKGFEGIVFKGSTKQTDCLLAVKSGTADFAVVDAQLANSYAGQGDYANLTIVDALTSVTPLTSSII